MSYAVKTHRHISASFALVAHYSKEILTKENECFPYREIDRIDLFAERIEQNSIYVVKFHKQKIDCYARRINKMVIGEKLP